MSNNKAKQSPLVRSFALICGAAAVTALALIAHASGNDSIAKGAVIGGSVTLVAIAALWIVGPRSSTASRIVNGEADEREQLNTTKAAADAGFAMVLACIGGLIAGMYGMPAPLVAGAILWVGLIVGVARLVMYTRRG